jgi:hypothetical protein
LVHRNAFNSGAASLFFTYEQSGAAVVFESAPAEAFEKAGKLERFARLEEQEEAFTIVTVRFGFSVTSGSSLL